MSAYDEDPAVAIDEQAWGTAAAWLSTARSAVLVCHLQPDADALGSMLALARALRARGLQVHCTWGDEVWRVPEGLAWLPDVTTCTPPASVPDAPELLVVLDTASRDRLGVLAPLAAAAGRVLVIDHHAAQSDAVEGLQLVDPAAASTTVVVDALLQRLRHPLDADTATLLYTGLVTDTGSFAHSVTTPAVHRVAARLLAAGADPAGIAQRLWGTRSFAYALVLGRALSRVRLDEAAAGGRGVVWTWTTAEDLEVTGAGVEDLEHLVEVLRRTTEADVAVVLKQHPDGAYRASTRSRGATDVGSACAALGGGGHRLAAGFSSDAEPETTMRAFLDALAVAPVLEQAAG